MKFSISSTVLSMLSIFSIPNKVYCKDLCKDSIVVFGDSLSDTGNLFALAGLPPAAAYYSGRFTNGNLWIDYLAGLMNLESPAARYPESPNSTNYAIAGASSGSDDITSWVPALTGSPLKLPAKGLRKQIGDFLNDVEGGGHSNRCPDSLFVIWVGVVDFMMLGDGPDYMNIIKNIKDSIEDLINDVGATNILVLNLPQLVHSPAAVGTYTSLFINATIPDNLEDSIEMYNEELKQTLKQIEKDNRYCTKIVHSDVASILNQIAADPVSFGLSEDVGIPTINEGALFGAETLEFLNEANSLYFDGVHPTTTVHEHLAARVHQQILKSKSSAKKGSKTCKDNINAVKKGNKKSKKTTSKTSKTKTTNKELKKELCVIGGGAAGAYTAYEAQKRGYDTVLIEPQNDLGGNCEFVGVQSTIDPSVTYYVNAAVVIYSPTETVNLFFEEMDATVTPFVVSSGKTFVYGTPYGVFPAPPSDPAASFAALTEYTTIANSPPYVGSFNPLPIFENLSEKESLFLLEPFGQFLARNPGIQPLVPVMASLIQGYGLITELPVWEIFLGVPPRYILQLFTSTWLTLPNGCQELYDKLKDRMTNEDSNSVLLNTNVDRIVREEEGVTLHTKSNGNKNGKDLKSKYKCDDAVIAFRPEGLDGKTLEGITENEKHFFGNLTYNGYVPSLFRMELGPSLTAVGADMNTEMTFVSAPLVNVGAVTIIKSQPQADYPWRIFYQPSEPADTPEKLEAVKDELIAELTSIGFINIDCIFIKNHKYSVKPNSVQGVKDWVPFFDEQNNDNDNLYWTGAVAGGDGSEYVWEYSKRVLDENFPDKA